MKYQKLIPLKLGKITASGWLREQLERNKNGIGGHLDELEPLMIATPYTKRRTEQNWGGPGWGAEISGNFWYGLVNLAFTLDDDELKRKAGKWVDDVLSMQEDDGYMGAYAKTDNRREDYNAWGTACGMRAMISYYEATGREDVFGAVYRCMLWFCSEWADHKTPYAGHAITEPMLYCYDRTGDGRLLKFVMDYDRFLTENNLYNNSTETMADPKLRYNSNHTVAYGISMRRPALIYGSTGEQRYLDACSAAIKKIRAKAMQATGAPVSNNEWLSPVGASAESEYCNFAVYNAGYAVMAALTGDPIYGDYMEQIAYNAAEGARKKDEKAMTYMSSPNQIYASAESTHFISWHAMYAPIHPTSCCAVYSVHVFPDLVKNMIMTDSDDNLYFNVYGPCKAEHNGVTVQADTLYPFNDTIQIKFSLDAPKRFTVFFKIPYWCERYSVQINGETSGSVCEREWKDGDTVCLKFEMKISAGRIDDSHACKNYPLYIRRGALVFSFPIPENWSDAGNGCAVTPLPEGWRWYNVLPSGAKCWDIALDEENAAASIKVIEEPVRGYVWEDPPVKLEIDAYKAPYTYSPYGPKTYEMYDDLTEVTDKLRVTLVPYGCTALRITYFPRADMPGN